jgi:hypothetical protein
VDHSAIGGNEAADPALAHLQRTPQMSDSLALGGGRPGALSIKRVRCNRPIWLLFRERCACPLTERVWQQPLCFSRDNPVGQSGAFSEKPKDDQVNVPALPIFSGGVDVVSGVVLLLMAGIATVWVDEMLENSANSMTPEEEIAAINVSLRTKGIEKTLARMAREATLPVVVDNMTYAFPHRCRRNRVLSDLCG